MYLYEFGHNSKDTSVVFLNFSKISTKSLLLTKFCHCLIVAVISVLATADCVCNYHKTIV